MKANLQHAEKRITELEVKLYKQQQQPQPEQGERLNDLTEKVPKMFLDTEEEDDILGTEQLARALGIEKNVAEHHCDVLLEAKMIEWVGVGAYYIISKGRAYVVKYLLAKNGQGRSERDFLKRGRLLDCLWYCANSRGHW